MLQWLNATEPSLFLAKLWEMLNMLRRAFSLKDVQYMFRGIWGQCIIIKHIIYFYVELSVTF